ncbi:hypothetical protein IE81DRAFT_243652 [Ceraceosorus guamensis]|uniref:Uncharacterized protein n=1 Tax=Ceraceosorus guamensis TaxID=1522189 RepID=A0A316W4U7_9BASI|nr:hypothetical protein IE81DRAFT_243652 [Ceraceosorus guamensis]PWN44926.1 hypothetical protein IE81DRAFT_243652 [Ceraceosorus guamensis]
MSEGDFLATPLGSGPSASYLLVEAARRDTSPADEFPATPRQTSPAIASPARTPMSPAPVAATVPSTATPSILQSSAVFETRSQSETQREPRGGTHSTVVTTAPTTAITSAPPRNEEASPARSAASLNTPPPQKHEAIRSAEPCEPSQASHKSYSARSSSSRTDKEAADRELALRLQNEAAALSRPRRAASSKAVDYAPHSDKHGNPIKKVKGKSNSTSSNIRNGDTRQRSHEERKKSVDAELGAPKNRPQRPAKRVITLEDSDSEEEELELSSSPKRAAVDAESASRIEKDKRPTVEIVPPPRSESGRSPSRPHTLSRDGGASDAHHVRSREDSRDTCSPTNGRQNTKRRRLAVESQESEEEELPNSRPARLVSSTKDETSAGESDARTDSNKGSGAAERAAQNDVQMHTDQEVELDQADQAASSLPKGRGLRRKSKKNRNGWQESMSERSRSTNTSPTKSDVSARNTRQRGEERHGAGDGKDAQDAAADKTEQAPAKSGHALEQGGPADADGYEVEDGDPLSSPVVSQRVEPKTKGLKKRQDPKPKQKKAGKESAKQSKDEAESNHLRSATSKASNSVSADQAAEVRQGSAENRKDDDGPNRKFQEPEVRNDASAPARKELPVSKIDLPGKGSPLTPANRNAKVSVGTPTPGSADLRRSFSGKPLSSLVSSSGGHRRPGLGRRSHVPSLHPNRIESPKIRAPIPIKPTKAQLERELDSDEERALANETPEQRMRRKIREAEEDYMEPPAGWTEGAATSGGPVGGPRDDQAVEYSADMDEYD